MARGKTERAKSKVATATALTGIGAGIGAVGGPIGAAIGGGIGALTGLIIGDESTVLPIDVVAIPAYQAYMIQGTPAIQYYIKAGETILATGGNVDDVEEGIAENVALQSLIVPESTKPRARSRWNEYTANPRNQIKYKSGKKKGLLNLKAMGVQYRKKHGIKKKGRR